MTDKLASLTCLSNRESTYSQKALDSFFLEWKNDNNVIDKWFSIQATSKLKNTLENIKKLSKHKLFDITNPNKVRALFSSFANLNPALFNTEE
jgi:aminopeptidase N